MVLAFLSGMLSVMGAMDLLSVTKPPIFSKPIAAVLVLIGIVLFCIGIVTPSFLF